ncbi:MAG TPA: efflux RND transporter periplasmic adaptor subunit, partial [Polyangia bacterium]|nr:efflux RND transporter periplasmic adaptor subunit [Polyangia bacterium]
HPGQCPICSMTLVPRPSGTAPTAPATSMAPSPSPAPSAKPVNGLADVELPADRVALIGMRTAKVERAPLGDALRAVGVIAANERGLAQISVRFSGWVQQLLVSETGQRVKRGQVLASVYSPEVVRAEQEYLTARGWEAKGDSAGGSGGGLAADARRRLELLGIAAQEIDALGARGKVGDSVPIRSPAEGYVTAKNVVPGAAIAPGAPLFEVADLSRVWLLADVYEQEAARLRIGQKATLELTAYPGEHFPGRVQFIYPTLNASTRTLRVRLEFANKTGPSGVKLRPGMYGNVSLALPSALGLVIPSEALVDTGEHQYVFVSRGEGHFSPRLVHVGARAGDRVQITDGISEGDTVVTTGNFLIDSESRLRAAIEGQAASPAAAASASGEDPDCGRDFDAQRFPDKARACRACDIQHRGMGTMAQDCKAAIEKPWK